jgi:hypothetical protein
VVRPGRQASVSLVLANIGEKERVTGNQAVARLSRVILNSARLLTALLFVSCSNGVRSRPPLFVLARRSFSFTHPLLRAIFSRD